MKVAIIGAGIMGSGIAQLVAMRGEESHCFDVSEEQLERARGTVDRSLARFVKAEKMTAEDIATCRQHLSFSTDFSATVRDADVVIEAVPELLELKQDVLSRAIAEAPAEALLGTNTSQLSITAIAAGLGEDAPRLVGTHFFNPPVIMRLVEVVAGFTTPAEIVQRAAEFAEHLGKEVVICRKDTPGFITTRAYAALRTECLRMLDEELASAADIDKALRLAFNFPMGPFELSDMNGVDTYLHVLNGLHSAFGERFAPPVALRNMIAAGRTGRKAGAGFFDYDGES